MYTVYPKAKLNKVNNLAVHMMRYIVCSLGYRKREYTKAKALTCMPP